jgi:transposase InsO family protein
MPKIRRDAVIFAKKHGVRTAARHFGFSPGTISKWRVKAQKYGYGEIPTRSSRPRSHPQQLDEERVDAIVQMRLETKRCAQVVHKYVQEKGYSVSLSSVKRTLKRKYLIKQRSPWKKMNISPRRPSIEKPGDLVQLDTIHLWRGGRPVVYIYTLIDVHSRCCYARAYTSVSCTSSIDFVRRAQRYLPFRFTMLQTDNGPEFTKFFTQQIKTSHRHTRVRKPNDNAHIERFNRTLKHECVTRLMSVDVSVLNTAIQKYLDHYNRTRYHLGIEMKTPLEVVRCFQAIG